MPSTMSCLECPYCSGFIAFCGHPGLSIDDDFGIPFDLYHSGGVLPNCPLGPREVRLYPAEVSGEISPDGGESEGGI